MTGVLCSRYGLPAFVVSEIMEILVVPVPEMLGVSGCEGTSIGLVLL